MKCISSSAMELPHLGPVLLPSLLIPSHILLIPASKLSQLSARSPNWPSFSDSRGILNLLDYSEWGKLLLSVSQHLHPFFTLAFKSQERGILLLCHYFPRSQGLLLPLGSCFAGYCLYASICSSEASLDISLHLTNMFKLTLSKKTKQTNPPQKTEKTSSQNNKRLLLCKTLWPWYHLFTFVCWQIVCTYHTLLGIWLATSIMLKLFSYWSPTSHSL